jgi:Domain of unknown function (DUF3854)
MNLLYAETPVLYGSKGRSNDNNSRSVSPLPDRSPEKAYERAMRDRWPISPELFDAAVTMIEDNGYWEPNRALGQYVPIQYQRIPPHRYQSIAMLLNEDAFYWQGRPEVARIDKKGKVVKYESPVGNGSRAFLPAIPVKTWRKICDRHNLKEESVWLQDLAKSETPLLLLQKWSAFGGNPSMPLDGEISGTGFSLSPSASTIRSQCLTLLRGYLQNGTQELMCLRQGNPSKAFQAAFSSFLASLSIKTKVPNFWKYVEANHKLPIVLTEGGAKSLQALDNGYIAISLYGVNAGVSKYETVGGDRVQKACPELIPDLQRFAVPDRRWTIAFDQDTEARTRIKVASATGDLAYHLTAAGSEVSIAQWHPRKGKGLDDLINQSGIEEWDQAYAEAQPYIQWQIHRELNQRLTRKPDLNVGQSEIAPYADQLPTSGIIALVANKGVGKSTAIGAIVSGRTYLSVTHRVSIGRDQASAWGGVLVNDGDRYGDRLLDGTGAIVAGGSVCVPSLPKVTQVTAEVLVLDEITAVLEFLLSSKLCNKDGARSVLLSELTRRIREAKLVILADADMTEAALAYVEAIRGERAYLVKSDRVALSYDAHLINATRNEAIAAMLDRAAVMEDEKILIVLTDGRGDANTIARLLEANSYPTLKITSETIGGQIEQSFLSSKGRDLPSLRLQGIRAIVASPSITQGFSIQNQTGQIDSVWGFYRGGSITPKEICQGLDRLRSNTTPRFIHLSKAGSAYSPLSRATNPKQFVRDLAAASTGAARIVRHSLTPEAIAGVEGLDWQSANIKMLAEFGADRNRSMGQLRDRTIAMLTHEGKRLIPWKPLISREEAAIAKTQLKAARNAIKAEHAAAIANARAITPQEATMLQTKTDPLTPEEQLLLERFFIADFYQCDVNDDLVLNDRDGRLRQQIRNLERILNPDLAIEHTAKSINASPENPQDWDKAALKNWLLEQSGAAELIRQMYDETIGEFGTETIAPIADFVRQHAREYAIAWGPDVRKVADQQIIGYFVAETPIKTVRHAHRKTYSVKRGNDGLDGIKATMERREAVRSPHPITIDNMPGDQAPKNQTSPLTSTQINPAAGQEFGVGVRESEVITPVLDRYGYESNDFGEIAA